MSVLGKVSVTPKSSDADNNNKNSNNKKQCKNTKKVWFARNPHNGELQCDLIPDAHAAEENDQVNRWWSKEELDITMAECQALAASCQQDPAYVQALEVLYHSNDSTRNITQEDVQQAALQLWKLQGTARGLERWILHTKTNELIAKHYQVVQRAWKAVRKQKNSPLGRRSPSPTRIMQGNECHSSPISPMSTTSAASSSSSSAPCPFRQVRKQAKIASRLSVSSASALANLDVEAAAMAYLDKGRSKRRSKSPRNDKSRRSFVSESSEGGKRSRRHSLY